jgi:cation:H+ antiporter
VIAYGDVIGANIAICLVALGVGAVIAPLPFGAGVRPYALLAIPTGIAAAALAWDGRVDRPEGALLVGAYVAYVALIWLRERRPPALGEADEVAEARAENVRGQGRVGVELVAVVGGVAALAVGAVLVVEAVRRLTDVESSQTILGLTIVGFATAFELVVLAWSSARHEVSEAVVAAVVGSFAYNSTMTLGAGALARPLRLTDADLLHLPWVLMLASLVLVVVLGWRGRQLDRPRGVALLAAYPVVVVALSLVAQGR